MIVYSNLEDLLHSVCDHVHELGVGNCSVTCFDDPLKLQIGFQITHTDGDPQEYRISILDLKKVPFQYGALSTLEVRQKIASSLTLGKLPIIRYSDKIL